MSKEIQCKCCKEYWWETDIHSKSGLCPNCYDYVADLEAKLAESERKLEEYKKCNCKECMTDYEKKLNQIIDKYLNENIKLKQKLAEKDQAIESLQEINQSLGQTCNNDAKEIERLREQLKEEKNRNKKLNYEAQKYYEDAYCNDFQKQDKISFAVEQLEKVKEIFGRVKWYHGYCTFGEVKYFDDKLVSWTDFEKEIDKQIKSLKGEKK